MYFLLNMGIFHCYVSLAEGISHEFSDSFFKYFERFKGDDMKQREC